MYFNCVILKRQALMLRYNRVYSESDRCSLLSFSIDKILKQVQDDTSNRHSERTTEESLCFIILDPSAKASG